jgi:hypothetical protein
MESGASLGSIQSAIKKKKKPGKINIPINMNDIEIPEGAEIIVQIQPQSRKGSVKSLGSSNSFHKDKFQ